MPIEQSRIWQLTQAFRGLHTHHLAAATAIDNLLAAANDREASPTVILTQFAKLATSLRRNAEHYEPIIGLEEFRYRKTHRANAKQKERQAELRRIQGAKPQANRAETPIEVMATYSPEFIHKMGEQITNGPPVDLIAKYGQSTLDEIARQVEIDAAAKENGAREYAIGTRAKLDIWHNETQVAKERIVAGISETAIDLPAGSEPEEGQSFAEALANIAKESP